MRERVLAQVFGGKLCTQYVRVLPASSSCAKPSDCIDSVVQDVVGQLEGLEV